MTSKSPAGVVHVVWLLLIACALPITVAMLTAR